jgi:hypothetical protein
MLEEGAKHIDHHRLSRRHLLSGTGIAGALPLLAAEPVAPQRAFPKDAEEALARLKDGNQRVADGNTRHAHQSVN